MSPLCAASASSASSSALDRPERPKTKHTRERVPTPGQRIHVLRIAARRAQLDGSMSTPTSSRTPTAASLGPSSAHVARPVARVPP
eukprot:CAMPEP_0118841106 /NCGR_PEP_ID=MMETSP1162-20130426/75095_1 /TAXON_ID=33656 /ORGANISM="Phaeocystis Sp, Strain CCMP2710" /LENGTH=85 /DNA_ID=CAMNT_0006773129 /DNA_START=88 /DNA_END=341 /DNA_ORIENTATION=+